MLCNLKIFKMEKKSIYLFVVVLFLIISSTLKAQSGAEFQPDSLRSDTLPRERLCGIKAYLPETMAGVYHQSYGINLYEEFPDFPRLVSTGNDRKDMETLLNAVDAYTQSNNVFRKRIGLNY